MNKFLKKNSYFFILLVILITHAVILTKLIYFPYPELFIYPYLTNNGLKPYSQILDQHFPGLMFLPINFNNLGMTTPQIAKVWSITIVIIIHIMLFFVSKIILKSRGKALLVNIFYLVWQPFFEGWVLWIDNFLPLILLPAFYFLYRGKVFILGILLGLAIVFKQIIIPLSLFVVVYTFWKTHNFRIVLRFLMGLAIPLSLMMVYLVGIGVLKDFWYWTVVFNLTTYAKEGRGTSPTLAHFSRVLVVFGSAFLIIKKIRLKEAQILLIFLVGTLIGLSTRFDFVHFQPALPFAILATVYAVMQLGWLVRVGFMAVYSLILAWWLIIFYKGHLGDHVISFDSDTKNLATKVMEYTTPGEKIFIFGGVPHLYQMSATLPAGDIFVFQFPWFYKVAEERILEGLKEDKPNIVVSDRTVSIENQKITDFAKYLDQYLNQNYQKIDSVGTADILRKKS